MPVIVQTVLVKVETHPCEVLVKLTVLAKAVCPPGTVIKVNASDCVAGETYDGRRPRSLLRRLGTVIRIEACAVRVGALDDPGAGTMPRP
jgi:hypothetical protein